MCNNQMKDQVTSKVQLEGQKSINACEDHPLLIPKQELLFLPAPQEAASGVNVLVFSFFIEARRLFSARLNWRSSSEWL